MALQTSRPRRLDKKQIVVVAVLSCFDSSEFLSSEAPNAADLKTANDQEDLDLLDVLRFKEMDTFDAGNKDDLIKMLSIYVYLFHLVFN